MTLPAHINEDAGSMLPALMQDIDEGHEALQWFLETMQH